MTTISPAIKRPAPRTRGFTLPEVLIATTLSVVAMGGILSTSLMISRTGYRVEQYTDMENESRKSLEQFGQDVRMAQDVAWHDANSLTLTIPVGPTGSSTRTCSYAYDATARTFSRVEAGKTTILLTGIRDCTLMGFKINGDPTHTSSTPASTWGVISNSTKQLQLSVSSDRSQTANVNTSQKVISARFILRNKRVT
jgi:prepilin-type N-terminal cleavage/methylation domain-containing protein